MTPPASRRIPDDAAVVPLREYVEARIESSHSAVLTEVAHLRSEMSRSNAETRRELAASQAQASKEHGEVRGDLAELTRQVGALAKTAAVDQARREGRRGVLITTSKALAALAALAGFLGFVTDALPS